MADLSKLEKKMVRELIDRGLNRDYLEGIKSVKKVCDSFIEGKSDPKEYYHKLFSVLHSKDKIIARRYNGITGSHYIMRLGILFSDGVLTQEDLRGVDENLKKRLLPYM